MDVARRKWILTVDSSGGVFEADVQLVEAFVDRGSAASHQDQQNHAMSGRGGGYGHCFVSRGGSAKAGLGSG